MEKDMKVKTIMLHYTKFGLLRSPNMQFDILRNIDYLKQRYNFVTLNQAQLPSEIGHIKSIKLLTIEIKKNKPDVIHIIGIKEGFHCMIASILAGCKNRILITHGFSGLTIKGNKIKLFFYRWLIEPLVLVMATKVQCNSKFSMSQRMIKIFAKKKAILLYNFFEPFSFNSKQIWKEANNIPVEDFLIVTIGNMHQGKGYDILEKVIHHYKFANNLRFVIIGDGEMKSSFDNNLNDLIESKKVFSLGKLEHYSTMQILSEASIFYLPTRFETLGMVFAEAGFCEVPSIGTNVGAVSEIIEDGRTGFLVNVDDVSTSIIKIDELLSNSELRKEMGKSARKHIIEMFDNNAIAKMITSLYENEI